MYDETRAHRALAGASRVRLLEVLRRAGRPLDVRELAERSQLHVNTVRAHLDLLHDAGLIDVEALPRPGPGRPRLVYRPSGRVARSGRDDGFRLLADILAGELPGPATAAGRSRGRLLAAENTPTGPLDAAGAREWLVALMDRLGFAAELAEQGRLMRLRRCPFEEVATAHPEVVCSVHLGLMQGALDALDAPVVAEQLVPYAEPDACTVTLAGRSVR